MTRTVKVATIILALSLFGCKGSTPSSAASPADGASSANIVAVSSTTSAGTRAEPITDPTMNNMKAGEVTIPANWHFKGALLQGASCDSAPFFVFRATSPDGLSYVERLPSLSWVWGTGPMAAKNKGTCLPLEKAMSAQDFLKYLAATMKVDYVADVPVPASKNAAIQKSAQAYDQNLSMTSTRNTAESASAIVTFKNGSFTMKGLYSTTVGCITTTFKGTPSTFPGRPGMAPSETHRCSAGVRYLVAPEAQFETVKKMWEPSNMGGKPSPEWVQALQRRQQEQGDAMLAQQRQTIAQQNGMLRQQAQQSNAQLRAQHDQFEQSQAVQQHMHEQFLSTMQRGTDMSMARTQQSMNARSTANSDWVDYALDQRTVADPNTGQVTKVSSSYTNTWIDSTGKVSYQTNDPNANPNGVLQGNWTKQTVVHGDGSQ